MIVDDQPAIPPAKFLRRARRLKMTGIVVLLLGMAGAALVYWQGTRTPDVRDDISMLAYNRAENRQMGQLYGKWGTMIEDLQDDLKNPGNQAAIIVVVSVLAAFGCFYLADRFEGDGAAVDGNDSPQA